MTTGILAAALGLVIAAACIGIPQLVRKRRTQPDEDDTQAYLRQTGRSARDISESNAALRAQQQKDAGSHHGRP
jgi:flagellar biosynthesis/type III secretory pathway M-ring protein FliF/YscJ